MGWGELPEYLRMVAALIFVLSLMGGLVFVLKKLGLGGPMPNSTGKKRLKVLEIMPLDAKHRLMLIQRDNVQHLILVGGNGEVIVESNIKSDDNDGHV